LVAFKNQIAEKAISEIVKGNDLPEFKQKEKDIER